MPFVWAYYGQLLHWELTTKTTIICRHNTESPESLAINTFVTPFRATCYYHLTQFNAFAYPMYNRKRRVFNRQGIAMYMCEKVFNVYKIPFKLCWKGNSLALTFIEIGVVSNFHHSWEVLCLKLRNLNPFSLVNLFPRGAWKLKTKFKTNFVMTVCQGTKSIQRDIKMWTFSSRISIFHTHNLL